MKRQYSTLQQNSKNSFVITDYEINNHSKSIHIKYRHIFLLILVIILVIIVKGAVKSSLQQKQFYNESAVRNEDTVQNSVVSFYEEGIIFLNSSSEYLSEGDIAALKNNESNYNYSFQELLQFAINEIYARHGYVFTKDPYRNWYNQFDWYNGIPAKTVTWNDFNIYEQKNIDLLVSYRK